MAPPERMEREKPIAHKLSLAHRNEERRLNKIREAVASVVGEEDAAHLWDWYVIETGDWNAEVQTVTPSQRTDPSPHFSPRGLNEAALYAINVV